MINSRLDELIEKWEINLNKNGIASMNRWNIEHFIEDLKSLKSEQEEYDNSDDLSKALLSLEGTKEFEEMNKKAKEFMESEKDRKVVEIKKECGCAVGLDGKCVRCGKNFVIASSGKVC